MGKNSAYLYVVSMNGEIFNNFCVWVAKHTLRKHTDFLQVPRKFCIFTKCSTAFAT